VLEDVPTEVEPVDAVGDDDEVLAPVLCDTDEICGCELDEEEPDTWPPKAVCDVAAAPGTGGENALGEGLGLGGRTKPGR
jgi:hypothetical protein